MLISTSVRAQNNDESSLYRYAPAAQEPLLGRSAPTTLSDDKNFWANLFFENCLKANQAESLTDYNTQFCACSAAMLPAQMSLRDIQRAFVDKDTWRGHYARADIHLLVQAPCLQDLIYDYAFDECSGQLMQARLLSPRRDKICACKARHLEERFDKTIIPHHNDRQDPVDNFFLSTVEGTWWVTQSSMVATSCATAYKGEQALQ